MNTYRPSASEIARLFNESWKESERRGIVKLIYAPLSGVSAEAVRELIRTDRQAEFEVLRKEAYDATYKIS